MHSNVATRVEELQRAVHRKLRITNFKLRESQNVIRN